MAPLELDFVLICDKLRAWQSELEPSLRAPQNPEAHESAVRLKQQIGAALVCLEFCERHNLHPARLQKAQVLPPTASSFAGEYRIMDDQDSGDPSDWVDPVVDGKPEIFYVSAGAVIV